MNDPTSSFSPVQVSKLFPSFNALQLSKLKSKSIETQHLKFQASNNFSALLAPPVRHVIRGMRNATLHLIPMVHRKEHRLDSIVGHMQSPRGG